MRKLHLTNTDIEAFVSDEDYDRVLQHRWRMMNTGYVCTGSIENRPGKTYRDDFQLLHRFILGLGKGRVPEVDHRNKIKHDCTRENIWICSRSENARNQEQSDRELPKGVHLLESGNYRALVRHNGRAIHLGCYPTVDEAKAARINWEKLNW